MRNIITLGVLVFSMAVVSQSYAQSGSRGGSGSKPGRQQQELIRQQQAQQAQQAAQLRAAQSKQQFKQTLSQLASKDNRKVNSRQNRQALEEAKRDYRNLRQGQATADTLGTLQVPFRLTKKEINRKNNTASWPSALKKEEFGTLVETIDSAIMERAIASTESATEFLTNLGELNSALSTAAAEGRVDITSYAKARRFITGLANETRATDLVR